MNKRIIYEIKGMYRDDFRITGFEFGSGEKSVCIVGNSRGNEVQQIYCCSQLVKKMKQLEEEGRILEKIKDLKKKTSAELLAIMDKMRCEKLANKCLIVVKWSATMMTRPKAVTKSVIALFFGQKEIFLRRRTL